MSNLLCDSYEVLPIYLLTASFCLEESVNIGGLDTVPVYRWDILRDSAGLSSRDRQADGDEHHMITMWEPWLPADVLFPPVNATALCVIHVWQLSFFPLL